jgi:Membrane bound beta barrel domain (DUF5777)
MTKLYLSLLTLICMTSLSAQTDIVDDLLNETKPKFDYVAYTFKTTRVICGHSIEPTKKNAIDFRIAHRFGDIATTEAKHTLIGFYAISDILLSLEYGATNDLSVGISGAKGAGPFGELYMGFVKYRVLKQTTDFKIPLTISLYGNACISGQKTDPFTGNVLKTQNASGAHRMSYMLQTMLAVKATDWLSLQLSPTFLWRNYVDTTGGQYITKVVKDASTNAATQHDNNAMFFLGLSARAKISKRTAILFEYFMPIGGGTYRQYFPMLRGIKDAGYYPCMNLGMEFETGGHVFHVNLSNTQGLVENDYLAYNTANWAQGQFRLGFTISRMFPLSATERRANKEKRKAKAALAP